MNETRSTPSRLLSVEPVDNAGRYSVELEFDAGDTRCYGVTVEVSTIADQKVYTVSGSRDLEEQMPNAPARRNLCSLVVRRHQGQALVLPVELEELR